MAKDIEKSNIELNTFNTRGLGEVVKRRLVFSWLQEHHKGITFLQETHSTESSEKLWRNNRVGKYYSHMAAVTCVGLPFCYHKTYNMILNMLGVTKKDV